MKKIKYHSKFGSLKKLPNFLNKTINICGFVNGNMISILPERKFNSYTYQGNQFVFGHMQYGSKEVKGELLTISTQKNSRLLYDFNSVDEKLLSYHSFSTPLKYHTSSFENFYPHESMTNINIQNHTLLKCDLFGYDAKRIIPEFPDEPDSTPYDIDLNFVHSVALHFDKDLVLFLDIDYIDSKINYMSLYILSVKSYKEEFLENRLLVKDDWGYLRYELLFSYGDEK